LRPVNPNFENAKVPANVTQYFAEVTVDYKHLPVRVSVWDDRSKRKRLSPWQAYIERSFSGSPDVLWIRCAHGFEPTGVSQDPSGEIVNDGNMVGPELRTDRVTNVKLTCKRAEE
jgi:hypothetical protein